MWLHSSLVKCWEWISYGLKSHKLNSSRRPYDYYKRRVRASLAYVTTKRRPDSVYWSFNMLACINRSLDGQLSNYCLVPRTAAYAENDALYF